MASKPTVKEALPKKPSVRIKVTRTVKKAIPEKEVAKVKVTKRRVKRALPK